MAQTSYDQYLQQLMGDAYQQQGQRGMMAQPRSIAPADTSGIKAAFQGIKTANAEYKAPERADLNKVREDFLAKKAEESQKKLEEITKAVSAEGSDSGGDGGMMSDAGFAVSLSNGIMNVQALMDLGLISKDLGKALIADAYGKAFPGYDNPASVAPGEIGHAGYTAFSPSEGGGWGDGGTGVGVGGGSVGAGGGNAAGGFSTGGW